MNALSSLYKHVIATVRPKRGRPNRCKDLKFEREHDRQTQSPLFKLPTELRQQIFQYVLEAGDVIKLRGDTDPRIATTGNGELFRKTTRPVSLLKTCGRVYSETIPVLYGHNMFELNPLDTLRPFAAVPGTRWVRSLHISIPWLRGPPGGRKTDVRYRPGRKGPQIPNHLWAEIWGTLALFTSLSWVRVELNVTDSRFATIWAAHESEALAAFQDVLQPNAHGELILPWPQDIVTGKCAEELLVDWEVKRDLKRWRVISGELFVSD